MAAILEEQLRVYRLANLLRGVQEHELEWSAKFRATITNDSILHTLDILETARPSLVYDYTHSIRLEEVGKTLQLIDDDKAFAEFFRELQKFKSDNFEEIQAKIDAALGF